MMCNSANEFQRNNSIYSETNLELTHNLCVQLFDLFLTLNQMVYIITAALSCFDFILAKISGRQMVSFFFSKRKQYSILIGGDFY